MAVQSNVDSAFNLQHSNFKFSPRRRNVETLLLGCPFGYELRRRKSRYVYPYFIPIDLVIFFFENFFLIQKRRRFTLRFSIRRFLENNFRTGIILLGFFEQTIDLAIHLQRWKR